MQHPLAVARIVADFGLDDVTVAAALLHDTVEDTGTTLTTSSGLRLVTWPPSSTGSPSWSGSSSTPARPTQAATMRKMLVAMARDLRVLIIKLADRLHNMRTIAALPPGSRTASPARRSRSTPRWPTAWACRT